MQFSIHISSPLAYMAAHTHAKGQQIKLNDLNNAVENMKEKVIYRQ